MACTLTIVTNAASICAPFEWSSLVASSNKTWQQNDETFVYNNCFSIHKTFFGVRIVWTILCHTNFCINKNTWDIARTSSCWRDILSSYSFSTSLDVAGSVGLLSIVLCKECTRLSRLAKVALGWIRSTRQNEREHNQKSCRRCSKAWIVWLKYHQAIECIFPTRKLELSNFSHRRGNLQALLQHRLSVQHT